MRGKGDGTHQISVQLHPAELGAVQVTALIRNGELTVTVACADESARQAVIAALPTLHHQLSGALANVDVTHGSSTGVNVSVGHQAEQQSRDSRAGGEPEHGLSGGSSHSVAEAAAPSSNTNGRGHAANANLDRML